MKSGRVDYESATDEEALDALTECAKCEGILPAIETAHAIFGARRYAASHRGARILIGCSGRGDKDMSILHIDSDKRCGRPRPARAGRVSHRRISNPPSIRGQPRRRRGGLRRG